MDSAFHFARPSMLGNLITEKEHKVVNHGGNSRNDTIIKI